MFFQFEGAEQFGRLREDLARRYANANTRPEKHAAHLRLRALKLVWPVEEVLEAVQGLSMQSAQVRSQRAQAESLAAP